MKVGKNLLKILRELFIVIFGVFIAFWLNDYRNNQIEKQAKKELYQLIYEDLNRFYDSGKRDNEDGFIIFFEKLLADTKADLEAQRMPENLYLFGDYWNIEMIRSMLSAGKLNDIDANAFKAVSRYHTIHQNFLNQIENYNHFYEAYVIPNLDKGKDEFFDPETGVLRKRYGRLLYYQEAILGFAEATVELADVLRKRIETDYL